MQNTAEAVAAITRKHRGERTLIEFASLVGVESRQAVFNWEAAKSVPSSLLLYTAAIRGNQEARAWARECLQALDMPLPPEELPEEVTTDPSPISQDPT